MKKVFKVLGVVVLVILLALVIVPIAFKGKIKEVVIAEGNKMLDAEFNFGSLDLSLIRNFPNATVSLNDFALWGKGDFAQDTLVAAEKVSATINLMSLFSGDYEVVSVLVKNTTLNAIVLEDGRPNWDIMLPDDDDSEDDDDDDSDSNFNLELKKVTVDGLSLVYDDRQANMYAALNNLTASVSGDMSADETVLKLKTEIEKLYFRYEGVPYLNNVRVTADMKLDADLDDMKFTFSDNTITLNAIVASVEGVFAMPEDEVYDMDIKLNTEKVGFKEILSLIPAVYMTDFKGLKADGNVSLAAWAKGRMQGDDIPAFEASLAVDNGSFQYPDLPKGISNINVAALAKNPGGSADLTVVDVSKFSMTMAGNPFAATLHLTTPISDPAFAVTANGVIDLGTIEQIYPLEDMSLNGVLNANLNLKGRLSYVEKELYDRFEASGTLAVNDMVVKMSDMPDVTIHKSLFTFTPQYLNLSETTVGIGRSDITADCRLENYMGFALKGQTIKGSLNVKSNLLDLNELMGDSATDEATEGAAAEEAPMAAFKVPDNINFNMNTSLKKVLFSNIVLDDVAGNVAIHDSKLDMRNLSFNTLEGGVVANGYYSTAAGVESPELNASFKMNGLSFSKTFETFVTIQKLVPIFEGLHGSFSGSLALNTKMDKELNPQYNTMNGHGSLSTSNLNLSGIEAFDKIADAVNFPALKSLSVKDVKVDFDIKEGRVHTKPFDLKMGETNLNLSGSTGIDQTIDYSGKISLPAGSAIAKYTSVDLKIGGTFTAPKVTLDTKSMVNQAAQAVGQQLTDKLGDKLGVDLGDAEAQRTALIEQAQKAGDKLVEEAQKQSDKLVSEAKNALAKAGAELAGKKLVDTAQKQADALVAKATAEGDKLVEKAKNGEAAE